MKPIEAYVIHTLKDDKLDMAKQHVKISSFWIEEIAY